MTFFGLVSGSLAQDLVLERKKAIHHCHLKHKQQDETLVIKLFLL